MNYLINTTAHTYFIDTGMYFGDNLQELYCNETSTPRLCVVMNSTLSQMLFNISGRAISAAD